MSIENPQTKAELNEWSKKAIEEHKREVQEQYRKDHIFRPWLPSQWQTDEQ